MDGNIAHARVSSSSKRTISCIDFKGLATARFELETVATGDGGDTRAPRELLALAKSDAGHSQCSRVRLTLEKSAGRVAGPCPLIFQA